MNIEALQNMLDQGQDSLILRYGLGQALLKAGRAAESIPHLLKTLEFNGEYSAGWKLLAKAYAETNQVPLAIDTYEKGIAVAQKNGDIQAVKEMKVFLRRLRK